MADRPSLNHIETPFTILILANERLRDAEVACKVNLADARFLANRAEEPLQPPHFLAVSSWLHMPNCRPQLDYIPKSDTLGRNSTTY